MRLAGVAEEFETGEGVTRGGEGREERETCRARESERESGRRGEKSGARNEEAEKEAERAEKMERRNLPRR
ncbi:hypothetical protein GCM10023238_10640 [Streptomyces heliomycini]